MKYTDPNEVNLAVARLAQEQDRVDDLPSLVVSVALYEESYDEAVAYCMGLTEHPNSTVRGNAILGLGHLARRFGCLPESARTLISAGLKDPSEHVRGQASAAADDVRFFIG